MRVYTKLALAMALASTASAAFEHYLGSEGWHGALRHRQLKCIKRGNECGNDYEDDCCGNMECDDVDNVCCVPNGEKGCDDDDDCCGELTCGDVVDSLCGAADDDTSGGRPCQIHGEACTNDGGGVGNSCCGDVKYLCEVTVSSVYLDPPSEVCCIPPGGKGCGEDGHCCGSLDDNYCDDESRCVDPEGSFPTDAPGGRDCQLKGELCEDVEDCCGKTKYDCAVVGSASETTCCITTGLNGCEANSHCCSGYCNTEASLCEALPV